MFRICAIRTWPWTVWVINLLVLLSAVTLTTVSNTKPVYVTRPRLYVMDCGTIVATDLALYGLKAEEIHGDTAFVTPCYLIVHLKGTLLWDVGRIPDKDIPDDGTWLGFSALCPGQYTSGPAPGTEYAKLNRRDVLKAGEWVAAGAAGAKGGTLLILGTRAS